MYAIAKRYTRNEEDALEVINTAFLKVFSKIEQFDKRGAFEAWVRRIVVNTAIRFNRNNLNYRNNTSLTLDDNAHDIRRQIVENDAWGRMEIEEIFAIIRELPQATQVVFNMFILDGFSHKEIAEQLGISVNTSKWHVFAAREQIQATLKKKATEPLINYA